jgi:hypothetical protein
MSVTSHTSNPNSRRINRNIKKRLPLDHAFSRFSVELTKDAIAKSSNSIAVGPDGLTSMYLKFLGPHGLAYLNKLFNLSVAHANIPAVWKRDNIIPIP